VLVPYCIILVMDDDESGSAPLTIIGAIVVLIALFLPLFTVRYSPPGGSAVVYGRTVNAFVDPISGWQFASAAQWTHLLFVLGILLLPIIALICKAVGFDAGSIVSYGFHALVHIVVAFGWLIFLGFALLEGSLVMPINGEQGILPAFQANPFSRGYQQSIPNNPPTSHLTATLGIGWFVLLAGIAIGIWGVWRIAIIVTILMIVLLIVTFYASNSLFHSILLWL
jgi:hypothetical protein